MISQTYSESWSSITQSSENAFFPFNRFGFHSFFVAFFRACQCYAAISALRFESNLKQQISLKSTFNLAICVIVFGFYFFCSDLKSSLFFLLWRCNAGSRTRPRKPEKKTTTTTENKLHIQNEGVFYGWFVLLMHMINGKKIVIEHWALHETKCPNWRKYQKRLFSLLAPRQQH